MAQETQKEEFARRAADLARAAFRSGWSGGIRRMEGEVLKKKTTPSSLLERFAELYGETPLSGCMIEPGLKLWRDYFEWTGEHMILTDEGWEPGEAKANYEEMAKSEKLPLSSFIRDEVNMPIFSGVWPEISDAD